jgi:hypothetical protein
VLVLSSVGVVLPCGRLLCTVHDHYSWVGDHRRSWVGHCGLWMGVVVVHGGLSWLWMGHRCGLWALTIRGGGRRLHALSPSIGGGVVVVCGGSYSSVGVVTSWQGVFCHPRDGGVGRSPLLSLSCVVVSRCRPSFSLFVCWLVR